MTKAGYRGHEYKRWTLESLRPLHTRWMLGETLDFIAKSVQTTRGRLRGAFRYYDLKDTPRQGSEPLFTHSRPKRLRLQPRRQRKLETPKFRRHRPPLCPTL